MNAPTPSAGCSHCGSTRIDYRVEQYGARNQPLRARLLVCTCGDCGHRWIGSSTAPRPDASAGPA